MTAYLLLLGDSCIRTPDLRSELAGLLLDAGQRYLSGLGTLRGIIHPPHAPETLPFELSPADHATESWRLIPDTVSFLDIDNGWARLHEVDGPFSNEFKTYLRAFVTFFHTHAPYGFVGYLLWWDGRCDDLPPITVRRFASPEDLLDATPELRVVALAPAGPATQHGAATDKTAQ
jgi:hypothetical protein